MENKKSKRIFKVVMAAMSLALVAAISYGATLALMSSKTNNKNNVFTSSADLGIKITEDEKWGEPGAAVGTVNYTPGETIPKSPKIEIDGEKSDSAYIACRIMFLVEDDNGKLDEEGNAGTGYKQITYRDFLKVAKFTTSGTDQDSDGINDDWRVLENSKSNDQGLIVYYGQTHDNHYDLKLIDKENSSSTIFDNVVFGNQEALQKNYVTRDIVPGEPNIEKADTEFCLYGKDENGNPTYKNLVVKVFAYAVDTNLAGEATEKKIDTSLSYPTESLSSDPSKLGTNRGQNVLNRLIAGLPVDDGTEGQN